MAIRINNLDKWQELPAEMVLVCSGDHERRVRVEFNTVTDAIFHVVEGERRTYLGTIKGYDVIEFYAGATAEIVAESAGEIWFFTNDNDQISYESPHTESFTNTFFERAARNPQMEKMFQKFSQNVNLRLAHLSAENDILREQFRNAPVDESQGELPLDENGDGLSAGGDGAEQGEAAGAAELSAKGQGAPAKP